MKSTRQRAILQLIATRPVHSQEELASLLEAQGYEVTQATVSRDVKELGLIKVPLRNSSGTTTGTQQFKYIEPGISMNYSSRLHRVIAELVVKVAGSLNQIVLRTPAGGAMMVASAIDAAEWPEILGTLGGDDTVLVILSSAEHLPVVVQRFEDLRAEAQSV